MPRNVVRTRPAADAANLGIPRHTAALAVRVNESKTVPACVEAANDDELVRELACHAAALQDRPVPPADAQDVAELRPAATDHALESVASSGQSVVAAAERARSFGMAESTWSPVHPSPNRRTKGPVPTHWRKVSMSVMTLTLDTVQRSSETGLRVDIDALLTDLRRGGFDLRRVAFVCYLLGLGPNRNAAYAVRRRAAADGWQVTVFVDPFGWVVRLGRHEVVRTELLAWESRYIEELAQAYGGTVRGVSIEDLQRRDIWDQLTAQSCEPTAVAVTTLPAVVLTRRAAQSRDTAPREPARSA